MSAASAALPAPLGLEATAAASAAMDASGMVVLDDPLECERYTRFSFGPKGERQAESALALGGLHCSACAGLIEAALLAVPGVHAARVSAAASSATVGWNPALTRPSALIEAVRRAGYEAAPDLAAPARALRKHEHRQALWRLFVAGFCAMQVMMLATPGYVAAQGDLAPDLSRLLNVAGWVLSLPVLVFSAAPFFAGAWRSLRQWRIGMDTPVALGLAITFIASSGATFDPGGLFGDAVYFDSLTMFVAFLLGARYLELRARHAASQALEHELARLPETAERIEPDGTRSCISVLRLQRGDRVAVPLGAVFGADGVIEQGCTRADESMLSGESAAVKKQVGDEVSAGSLNLGGPVQMRVLRVGGETRLAVIVSMMQGALSQRPAAARLADRWAAPFLWAVLLLAGGAAAVWSVIEPSRAVWVAVSVLIVTCPCALSLAAPATLVAAARGLARRGVLLQRLDAVEALARADKFVFDKTGTLTDGEPQWRETRLSAAGSAVFGDGGSALQQALRRAAELAAASAHPLSRALVAAADAVVVAQRLPMIEIGETPGSGIEARDSEGRRWRLGAPAWVGDGGEAGHVALGRDGTVLATFDFEERLRPDADEALAALRADGIGIALLTGDASPRACALAQRLQITEIHAAATPAIKLQVVAKAQATGHRVAMVGDGINDAPVLARADVSLAMGQGALVARSQADAVITSNRLNDLVGAHRTAKKAVAIVRQNFIWAGAYNAICIPLALAGLLPPWAAGLGMAGSSLVVVANALRALRQT